MLALIADGWLRQQESVERARSEAAPGELRSEDEGRVAREGAVAGEGVPLEGVWAAERYRLASGPEHPLEGRIFFDDGEWQVVFFVLGVGSEEAAGGGAADGAAGGGGGAQTGEGAAVVRRGSAEGGRYEVRGDTVVFRHLFHLSAGDSVAGLPASPLRMEVTAAVEAAREPTRFVVEGDRLTLFFPSGNEIDFVRR